MLARVWNAKDSSVELQRLYSSGTPGQGTVYPSVSV